MSCLQLETKLDMRLFDREDELAKLAKLITNGRSFMFYGPAGVGKTRLLDELTPRFPLLLRVSSCNTAQALFHEIAAALWKRKHPELLRRFKSSEQLKGATASNVKGLCLLAFRDPKYMLVLEHTGFSSQPFSVAVKQVEAETGTPVMFVTRSSHMEDAGYLVRHYPGRTERLELADFNSDQAATFAACVGDEARLTAENRSEFLAKVTELSGGNPGAIIAMVGMACMPKYRSGDWIKSTPLYIDFRLARNAAISTL